MMGWVDEWIRPPIAGAKGLRPYIPSFFGSPPSPDTSRAATAISKTMDIAYLQSHYGDRLAFCGMVCVQSTSPSAPPRMSSARCAAGSLVEEIDDSIHSIGGSDEPGKINMSKLF
ncbi:MAG: hypothetical protein ACYDCO_10125 [Armatimonadota bacterium]